MRRLVLFIRRFLILIHIRFLFKESKGLALLDPPPATPVFHIPTFSAHTYPPPVDPSPDQPPTDPPWSVGPSPTQVDATNFVAIDTLQEPPPALPIRASSHVGDTQENQDQFYYSGPPLGLPPVSGAAVYLHVP